jgi:hypothetical protein
MLKSHLLIITWNVQGSCLYLSRVAKGIRLYAKIPLNIRELLATNGSSKFLLLSHETYAGKLVP